MIRLAVLIAGLSASAAHATTLIMLVSEQAAVIASDSLAHGSNRGVVDNSRRKVSRAGPRLVLGTAGVAALVDATGAMSVDLHTALVAEATRLTWRQPRADAEALGRFLRAELARLEQIALPGPPDRRVNPTVTVFLAARVKKRIVALRLTIPGALTPGIGGHRVAFGPVRVADVAIRKDTVTAEIVSRLPEVADGAADLVSHAGREYPAVMRLTDPRVPLSARTLEAAARELVEFTIKADREIGGAVQLEKL